jgi:hypothetical protein
MSHPCSFSEGRRQNVLRAAHWLLVLSIVLAVPARNSVAGAADRNHERGIAGVVRDEKGQPLAGATVWLLDARPEAFGRDGPSVLQRTRTDVKGRFHVALPRDWLETPQAWLAEPGLLAHRPGRRPAGIILDRESVPPETGVKLTLRPADRAEFQLVQPDGQPLPACAVTARDLVVERVRGPATLSEGASRVSMSSVPTGEGKPSEAVPQGRVVRMDRMMLPADLAATLSATTDAQGRVRLPNITLADLAGIRAESPNFGRQEFSAFLDFRTQKQFKPWPARLAVYPVGKVVGRLIAEPPSAAANARFLLRSFVFSSREKGMTAGGVARVTADAQGMFEVPALAAGALFAQSDAAGKLLLEVARNDRTVLKEGETLELKFPLKPAVHVRGLARERGTGRPLAHVRLATNLRGQPFSAAQQLLESDADGRFSFDALPGPIQWVEIFGRNVPSLCRQETSLLKREIPADVKEYDMPPLDLPTEKALMGSVTNVAGKAEAGARALGLWMVHDDRTHTMHPNVAQVTSDANGSFTIPGVPTNRVVRLKARSGTSSTKQAVVLQGDDLTKPVTLKVIAGLAHTARGRAIDEENHPIANAHVEIWWRPTTRALLEALPKRGMAAPGGGAIPEEAMPPTLGLITETQLILEGPLVTDSDGRFQTSEIIDADGEFQAAVRAEGFMPKRTAWKSHSAGRTFEWSELRLNHQRPLEGMVLDRAGKPVVGAKIMRADSRALLRTTSDSSGRFKLDVLFGGPGFLFVEADGFRFHGQANDSTKPLEITLTRDGEAAATRMTTLPFKLSKEERRALAEKLMAPRINRALEKEKEDERCRALEWIAGSDPARVLEILEKKSLQSDWWDGYVRRSVAKSLLTESADEARTVVDSMRDPSFRAQGYLDLCDALPAAQIEERRSLLAQALVHTRAVKEADKRTIDLGRIAERLWAVGDKHQATEIIHEGLESAKNLPTAGWSGYARGAFADSLAVIDLPAALDLIKHLQDAREFDRHHGNIACRLARTNPVEAGRVWGMMREPFYRGQHGIRVCYRMALQDPERAGRIADQITLPLNRADAHGAMAQALAGVDPKRATKMLKKAFAVLAEQAATGREDFNNFEGSSSLAAKLLPVAEAIDPALVPELFWRAVSYRFPRRNDDPYEAVHPRGWMADAALAYLLARYDRDVARLILDEATPFLLKQVNNGTYNLLDAATMVDPHLAVRLIGQIPAETDYVRERVASRLLRDWRLPPSWTAEEE